MYIIPILFVIDLFFDMDPRWKHPFTAIVAGPTGCGKTVFTLKIITLASEMITPVPEKIIWCFGVYQDEFDKYPDIDFREGLPDPSTFEGTTKTLLVLKKTPKRKKIDIIQKGGFLGALITPILSILGGSLRSNGSK